MDRIKSLKLWKNKIERRFSRFRRSRRSQESPDGSGVRSGSEGGRTANGFVERSGGAGCWPGRLKSTQRG